MEKIQLEILTTRFGCVKCKRAMDIVYSVAKDFKEMIEVREIDISDNPEVLMKFGVMTTPAIILDGKLIAEGTPKEKDLKEKIRVLVQ